MSKQYIITFTKPYTGRSYSSDPLTLAEAIEHYAYTLECGASYSNEAGNSKINMNPKSIAGLISNLINASNNLASNGCGNHYSYTIA